jgi:hypothetical protein
LRLFVKIETVRMAEPFWLMQLLLDDSICLAYAKPSARLLQLL